MRAFIIKYDYRISPAARELIVRPAFRRNGFEIADIFESGYAVQGESYIVAESENGKDRQDLVVAIESLFTKKVREKVRKHNERVSCQVNTKWNEGDKSTGLRNPNYIHNFIFPIDSREQVYLIYETMFDSVEKAKKRAKAKFNRRL
jgi:hypothetical protein